MHTLMCLREQKVTDKKGERSVRFKDSGFGSNNLSPAIYHDVPHKPGDYSKIREAWAIMKASHRSDTMRSYAVRDNQTVFPYSRFDGGPRLGKIEMDEWKSEGSKFLFTGKMAVSGGKTLKEIEDAVAAHLAIPSVQIELYERAKNLVHRRRRRMRDKSKWDRYASASWYDCQVGGCRDSTEDKTYDSFKEHIVREHFAHFRNLSPEQFEEDVLSHRKCWLYR